jgi:putative Mg2+ transporter-C (MgtC) family protein
MLVSMYMWEISHTADPGRIGAGIVTGIGFLGAGAILRFGFTIRGLTTASSIWAAAGIGLAVGAGFYVGAIACTLIVFIALAVLDILEKTFIRGRKIRRLVVVSKDRPQLLGQVEDCLQRHRSEILKIGLRRDVSESKVELDMTCSLPDKIDIQTLTAELSELTGVENVEIS